jgi:hypothetical protein
MIRFRAAPTLRTCGFLVVGEGTRTLRLLVLPRFWNTAEATAWISPDGATLSLVAPEGAELRLDLDESWKPVIEKACELAGTVVAEVEEDADAADGAETSDEVGDGNQPVPAADTLPSGIRRLKMPLCAMSSSIERRRPTPLVLDDDGAAFQTHLKNFDSLLRRAKERSVPSLLREEQRNRSVVTGGEGRTLLRLMLVHGELVSVIRSNLHRIRRGYMEVTEAEALIRGRVTQRGIAAIVTRSSLRIECTHDEFSELTPLFRLLMAALDRVSQQRFEIAEARIFPQQQAEQAASLRSQLLAIPSLSLQEASVLAPRLQLRGRLRAEWQEALELARIVLAPAQATQFDVRRMRESGASLQVVTSTFWEQSVLAAAMGSTKSSAGYIWQACGTGKQPDCLVAVRMDGFAGMTSEKIRENVTKFFLGGVAPEETVVGRTPAPATAAPQSAAPSNEAVRVVFDAKYTQARGSKTALSAPTSGYQYQMLAYSLLADNCVAAALVHPTEHDAAPRAGARYLRMVPKGPTPAVECHLLVVEHPFPSADDCGGNWNEYLRTFRRAVGGSVGERGDGAEGSAVGGI